MGFHNVPRVLNQLATKIRPRYLGLGLMWLWIFGLWFTPSVFADTSSGIRLLTWLISIGTSAIVMIIISFRPHRDTSLGTGWIIVSSLGMGLTTFGLILFPLEPLMYLNAAAGGFFSAFLWILWGEFYSSIDGELMEACTPASAIFVVLGIPLVASLAPPLSGIFIALLPLISGVLLLVTRGEGEAPSFPALLESTKRKETIPHLIVIDLGAMLCSMASGFVLAALSAHSVFTPNTMVCLVIGASIAVLVSVMTIFFARQIDFLSFFLWMLPVLIMALAVLASGLREGDSAAAALAFTVAFSNDCLFWIIFSNISHRGFCTPSESFGLSRGFIQIGCFIGSLLGFYIAPEGNAVQLICLVFICVCSAIFPLVVRQQGSFHQSITAYSGVTNSPVDEELIQLLATEYKLSPRECDVLDLLRKGRSVTYMRDVLYISKSTIETHIKHIYAKMDVHSKQELIDLIESRMRRSFR